MPRWGVPTIVEFTDPAPARESRLAATPGKARPESMVFAMSGMRKSGAGHHAERLDLLIIGETKIVSGRVVAATWDYG